MSLPHFIPCVVQVLFVSIRHSHVWSLGLLQFSLQSLLPLSRGYYTPVAWDLEPTLSQLLIWVALYLNSLLSLLNFTLSLHFPCACVVVIVVLNPWSHQTNTRSYTRDLNVNGANFPLIVRRKAKRLSSSSSFNPSPTTRGSDALHPAGRSVPIHLLRFRLMSLIFTD